MEGFFTGQILCIVALVCWYLMVAKEASKLSKSGLVGTLSLAQRLAEPSQVFEPLFFLEFLSLLED